MALQSQGSLLRYFSLLRLVSKELKDKVHTQNFVFIPGSDTVANSAVPIRTSPFNRGVHVDVREREMGK